MLELNLPHIEPIRFAKDILSKNSTTARVLVEFSQTPSLAMMIEAAAQSSAAFSDGSKKGGYLVGMKNIKLLNAASENFLEVEVVMKHSIENMSLLDFAVYEKSLLLCKGSLTIALS